MNEAIEELKDATTEETHRLDALRAVLRDNIVKQMPEGQDLPNIYIYCFRDVWGGVRISEVSYSYGSAGTSAMHSDYDAAPFIFAAERYLNDCLFEVEDHGDGAKYDPEQEARGRLLYWLMPDDERDGSNLPDWEDRNANPLAAEGEGDSDD